MQARTGGRRPDHTDAAWRVSGSTRSAAHRPFRAPLRADACNGGSTRLADTAGQLAASGWGQCPSHPGRVPTTPAPLSSLVPGAVAGRCRSVNGATKNGSRRYRVAGDTRRRPPFEGSYRIDTQLLCFPCIEFGILEILSSASRKLKKNYTESPLLLDFTSLTVRAQRRHQSVPSCTGLLDGGTRT